MADTWDSSEKVADAIPVHLRDHFKVTVIPGAGGPRVRHSDHNNNPSRMNVQTVEWNGRKFTRYEIADGTGISHSMISKMFNGARRPSVKNLQRLATFFGVTMDVCNNQILPRIEIKRV